MKADQKEEFLQMVKDQFKKRRTEIERIHNAILGIDKQLDDLDEDVDEKLPELIKKAEQERAEQEELLDSLNEQLEAFVVADNELVNQLETFLERKKEEIVHNTHEIYRENNFENTHDRLQDVQGQIVKKQNLVTKNEKMMKEFEEACYERTTDFQAEETQMKA